MKKYGFRGLLSVVLAAALFFAVTQKVSAEGASAFQRITVMEELTDGQYVLITGSGWAPGVLAEEWVTAVQPAVSGNVIADTAGAVWTLTAADGGVAFTDGNGVTISPRDDGENGIVSGDYSWNVTCANGLFSFHGVCGEEAVTLAASESDSMFRAFRDSAIAADPESCGFALYKRSETLPEPEEPAILTIAEAKAAANMDSITIQATVILADGQTVIVQDETGGMALSFQPAPEVGDILKITGTRSEAGFSVTEFEKTGTAQLPARETSLDALEALEYTRVLIKDAVLGNGVLTQGEISVPIIGPLPEGVRPGDTVEVYAVVLGGGQLRIAAADHVTAVKQETPKTIWYSVAPENIRPTDTVAVTMTTDGVTYALSNAEGEGLAPAAVAVTLENGTMASEERDALSWNISREEAGLCFAKAGSDAWLCTGDNDNAVRVGGGEARYWIIEEGYLKHLGTGRYLSVYESSDWRALTNTSIADGQTLAFWRLEGAGPGTVAEVVITPADGEIAAGTEITMTCASEGASIFYATSSDGEVYTEFSPYTQPICPESGFGTLYVKAYAAKEGLTDSAETAAVFTEDVSLGYDLYFGLLHAHTNLSDGFGNVEDAFSYAANVEGLDFFAVTDHSNSFDNADAGSIGTDGTAVSAEWAAGKAAAAAVTGEDFVGIFGYEMTWQDIKHLGHINTFNTPGWQSIDQPAYADQPTALAAYYETLTTAAGAIGQFNHPRTAYGEFENFGNYSPEYDEVMNLLEVGGENGFTAYGDYTKALDAGWHVAPTNSQNNHNGAWGDADSGRTVILANALTEADLYDAMRSRRVYATEDSDLTIYYEVNGCIMGSILGDTGSMTASVYLSDPTDSAIGTLEVIADGGAVVLTRTVETSSEALEFRVPTGYSYYYLRVTQPDGDIAVTAPVWVDKYEDMGIESFTADTQTPVRDQDVRFTLKLYNKEAVDFTVTSVECTAGETVIHEADVVGTVEAGNTLSYTFSYAHPGLGATEFHITVTGICGGEARTYEQTLSLRYRVPELVERILVDGSHGNAGTGTLSRLGELASEVHIGVTVFTEEMPENGGLLLITAPSEPFEDAFVEKVAEFVRCGGSVVICGQSDMGDWNLHTSSQLNRLLSAMGSTLRVNDDTAVDPGNNGGSQDALFVTNINTASKWCAKIRPEQFYGQHSGCTVEAGSGTWLVRGSETAQSVDMDEDGQNGAEVVLLACEDTDYGGTIFVSGGQFLSDAEMETPKNYWDAASANQTILEALLEIERVEWPLSTIADVRGGELGQVFRIRGYATSGTTNPYTTFDRTVYLQDDTGGIAIVPFTDTNIQVGTPMEVIGQLEIWEGNPALRITGYQLLEENFYRYVPKTSSHKDAMDYASNGGKLMQVEGKVVEITYTEDKKGISRFTVEDKTGDLAEVFIEDYIRSGAYGENTLAEEVKLGRTVRAMGILHLDADGIPVLRVRNCDEVVYVPPIPVPRISPDTGDPIGIAAAGMAASLTALLILQKKRKK